MRTLLAINVVVRVLAAVVLLAGPWTDQAAELAGWDVERFWAIVDDPGRPWVDHAVEYPPGSVIVFEALDAGDVVDLHRRLIVVTLAVDLAVAYLVGLLGGRRSATAYLLVGLPLVPMGLLRLDLAAVAFAVLAAVALQRRRPALFAVATTAGALIKIWPALLLAAAVALRRPLAAMATVFAMALSGLAWLAYTGWSLDAIQQVLALRGATGWHLESVPGSIVALTTGAEPRLELNAYRIGTLHPALVRAGQLLTLAVVAGVGFVVRARSTPPEDDGTVAGERMVSLLATVLLATTVSLVITAPLLSPQFLLWLTPWAALLAGGTGRPTPPVLATGAATTLTGFTLMVFGPAGVGAPLPAALLLVRDAALVAAAVTAVMAVLGPRRSDRAEDPLRQGGAGPRTAGTHP